MPTGGWAPPPRRRSPISPPGCATGRTSSGDQGCPGSGIDQAGVDRTGLERHVRPVAPGEVGWRRPRRGPRPAGGGGELRGAQLAAVEPDPDGAEALLQLGHVAQLRHQDRPRIGQREQRRAGIQDLPVRQDHQIARREQLRDLRGRNPGEAKLQVRTTSGGGLDLPPGSGGHKAGPRPAAAGRDRRARGRYARDAARSCTAGPGRSGAGPSPAPADRGRGGPPRACPPGIGAPIVAVGHDEARPRGRSGKRSSAARRPLALSAMKASTRRTNMRRNHLEARVQAVVVAEVVDRPEDADAAGARQQQSKRDATEAASDEAARVDHGVRMMQVPEVGRAPAGARQRPVVDRDALLAERRGQQSRVRIGGLLAVGGPGQDPHDAGLGSAPRAFPWARHRQPSRGSPIRPPCNASRIPGMPIRCKRTATASATGSSNQRTP